MRKIILIVGLFLFGGAGFASFPVDSFLHIAKNSSEPMVRGEAYGEILWHYISTENDSLFVMAESARTDAIESNYPFGEIIALEYQGLYLELVKNEYDKAAAFYLEAVEICESNNIDYLESLYHALGALFHATDNFKQALVYYGKTLEIVKPKKDTGLIASSLVNLGTVHSSLGDHNKGRELLYESLKYSKNHLESRNTAYSSIGNSFFREGDYEQANVWFSNAVQSINKDGWAPEAIFYSYLIDTKVKLGDIDDLEDYIDKGMELTNSSQSLRTKSFFYRSAAKAYAQLDQQDLALEYLDKFVETFESLKDKQRDAIVYDMEAKYESSKQKAALATSKRKNNQLIIGLGLLLLGLGAISYLLIENRKKNQRLDEQNKELQDANENASMLLREIHHRVKNNLQIVSSLISLQGRNTNDLGAKEVLGQSKGRIKAMALLHENLYESEKLSKINSREYFSKLIYSLFSSLVSAEQNIELIFNMSDIKLTIDDSLYLGLIINELITNSLKHGFKDRAKGQLTFQVQEKEEFYEFVVEDNGSGGDGSEVKSGLGSKLISSFVKKLGAQLFVQKGDGYRTKILMPKSKR